MTQYKINETFYLPAEVLFAMSLWENNSFNYEELEKSRNKITEGFPEVLIDISPPAIKSALEYYQIFFDLERKGDVGFITRGKEWDKEAVRSWFSFKGLVEEGLPVGEIISDIRNYRKH